MTSLPPLPPPGRPRQGVDLAEMRRSIDELQRRVEAWERVSESSVEQDIIPADAMTVFTVMPFEPDDLQFVYRHVVLPSLEKCGVVCIRGDDMFGSGVIMEDVLKWIESADIVLADLTGQNANVFYEVGIAHAKEKPVLLFAQSLDDVPFDLRHRRIVPYTYSPPGVMALGEKLVEHIVAMAQTIRTERAS